MASREQIERASPIPLYECDLKVGDLVRIIATDAGYDPADKLYVVGVEWRHQRGRTDFGWNITIASAANIEKGYGACDGWRPDDLRRDYSVTVDSALTQNEDVAGMVEQLRHAAFTEPEPNRSALHSKAADLIKAQAAQIASLSAKVAEGERERDDLRRHLPCDEMVKEHAAVRAELARLESLSTDEWRARASELQREVERLRSALKMPDANRRLWLISDLLAQNGHFNRADICNAFGVSVPQASLDIKRWIALHPHAAVYNRSAKQYEIARAALQQESE